MRGAGRPGSEAHVPMPVPGLCWLLCCRRGFSLLGRDYGEAETAEELVEVQRKPVRTVSSDQSMGDPESQDSPEPPEEMRRLIKQKVKRDSVIVKGDVVIQGWLFLQLPTSTKVPWPRVRKRWFVLTQDSLDVYNSNAPSARRLGSMVLTSLCSIRGADSSCFRRTGYWNVTVYGRKNHYELYTKKLSECIQWTQAIQRVISSKAPVQTPTSLLIRDIEENVSNMEMVEQIYKWNPILQHSQKPLYAPLLPFPYGAASYCARSTKGYTNLQDEALKVFNSLQQLETEREPIPLIQGILQTGLDLESLRDEIYCQLIKQTCNPPRAGGAGDLRNWHLLTCMSITFLPSSSVLGYLSFHIQRSRLQFPDTEIERYAEFIAGSLGKTKGRLCVPSSQEIRLLTRRQQMKCTIYYAGSSFCKLAINSHTTAAEVVRSLLARLDLQNSRNHYALFEQTRRDESLVGDDTIVADVLTRFSASVAEAESECRLCFKLLCFLEPDRGPANNVELRIFFEQAHEMVVKGCLPAPEETLHTLAALRLQFTFRDFSPHAPLPRLQELFPVSALRCRLTQAGKQPPPAGLRKGRGHLLPETLARSLWGATGHKQRLEEEQALRVQLKEESAATMSSIVEQWKRLQGTGQVDAMTAYLSILKQWGVYGASLFEVQLFATTSGSMAETRCLAIDAKAVSLYKPGDIESVESFDYHQISSFETTDKKTLKVTLNKRTLLLESCKAREISQLMKIYSTHHCRTWTRAGCHPTKPRTTGALPNTPQRVQYKDFSTEQTFTSGGM
ncbi:pleckstrin homology domain-containing family H member 3 isoform X2 [Hypanus sabinus]|uniref:pleckstrin homology domain-containing family H member 3 isoform X2 n=1 Tax=Hypanus sabinus TaxID=79690 RepID=UPI0028C50529|nr:pleckstrin homology domain-containing family H member 3 isoform X2 [Hypanus sabinus]